MQLHASFHNVILLANFYFLALDMLNDKGIQYMLLSSLNAYRTPTTLDAVMNSSSITKSRYAINMTKAMKRISPSIRAMLL